MAAVFRNSNMLLRSTSQLSSSLSRQPIRALGSYQGSSLKTRAPSCQSDAVGVKARGSYSTTCRRDCIATEGTAFVKLSPSIERSSNPVRRSRQISPLTRRAYSDESSTTSEQEPKVEERLAEVDQLLTNIQVDQQPSMTTRGDTTSASRRTEEMSIQECVSLLRQEKACNLIVIDLKQQQQQQQSFADEDESFTQQQQSFADEDKSFAQQQQSFADEDESLTQQQQSFADEDESFTQQQQSFADEHESFTSYFVTCSGLSTRHLRAMSSTLAKEMKGVEHFRVKRVFVEGDDCEDWMLVDIGNIVVHFLLEEKREELELEKLWLLGSDYDDQIRAAKKMDEDVNF